jgi:dTDP-glucose 4,6-dehydratase
MTGEKILVTGADGFIGSHLTESLVRAGYDVRAFTMYNSLGSRGWLDECAKDVEGKFEVIAGDLRDPHAVQVAMTGCMYVFHLAALIAIPYSYFAPSSYVDTNVTGTLNVLQAAKNLAISRVIHTSTSEVYGSAKFVPIDESHPLHGQSPYSATKIAADQLAFSFFASFELPVTIIRPFNTYGPRQSARAVIPSVITQIVSGKGSVNIGSVHPTRDFSYVADTVAGFLAALDAPNCLGEVINLGSNFEISIGETARMIANIMEVDLNLVTDIQRIRPEASEVDRLCANNCRAKEVLGWQPRYSGTQGFREGLVETIDWFTEHQNLSRYRTELYNV